MSSVAYRCPDSQEDPLDIPGSSLCLRDMKGGSQDVLGCPRDPPDNMWHLSEGHEWRIPGCPKNPGSSQD